MLHRLRFAHRELEPRRNAVLAKLDGAGHLKAPARHARSIRKMSDIPADLGQYHDRMSDPHPAQFAAYGFQQAAEAA